MEYVFLKVNILGHNLIIVVVYIPPDSNISDDSIHDISEKFD